CSRERGRPGTEARKVTESARRRHPRVAGSRLRSPSRAVGSHPHPGWGYGLLRSGFVAVAGRPNVGKSTLVNALCGGKVAIVSDKPQTTRNRISGIVSADDFQLVLMDLPGFQRPRDPLTERMQRTVDRSFEEVDAIL